MPLSSIRLSKNFDLLCIYCLLCFSVPVICRVICRTFYCVFSVYFDGQKQLFLTLFEYLVKALKNPRNTALLRHFQGFEVLINWRKRVGIEPTHRRITTAQTGFEVQATHQDRSASILTRFKLFSPNCWLTWTRSISHLLLFRVH